MKKVTNTKKLIAGLLLVVFTISVVPRKYFHDIIANHEDVAFKNSTSKEKSFTAYKFNCGFVELVAVSPFLASDISVNQNDHFFFGIHNIEFSTALFKNTFDYFTHRGPPIA